jgi:hypothetical protein
LARQLFARVEVHVRVYFGKENRRMVVVSFGKENHRKGVGGRIIQCVRKVAVHLGYGTYIRLSVSKMPLKSVVVSLYSFVKQRLKRNTGKVSNCLIQFLLTMVLSSLPTPFIGAQ